jgi:two-component system, OmpR family, response regulator
MAARGAASQRFLSKLTAAAITIGGVSRSVPAAAGQAHQNGARVLVVDDEPNITELVAMALRYEGFSVKTAATGRAALTAVTQFSPAVVILDVMLPDIDGIEVLRRLNSSGHKVPIIFLTAKDATEDKVHGLTVGGDDYVTKPFSIEELVARVRVVLRRHGVSGDEDGRLKLADLELDDEAHEVRRAGQVIPLTTTEYRLLRYLLINAGRVLTRSQILDHVWHYDFGGDASVLETYISYLRRKVDRFDPPLLHTVRGVGYVLRAPRT